MQSKKNRPKNKASFNVIVSRRNDILQVDMNLRVQFCVYRPSNAYFLS